jgi:Flp pilus assembly CpaF family ATPase
MRLKMNRRFAFWKFSNGKINKGGLLTQNTTINQHIHEFLEYYIKLDKPEYAVLLSGKWGSGKTHFINRFKSEAIAKNLNNTIS